MRNNGLFISGTDTGIGKTLVSAMLILAGRGRYWKPVQSGISDGTDLETVRKLTGLSEHHFIKESYRLTEPKSPHFAAKIDGVNVDRSRILADFSAIMVGSRTDEAFDYNVDEVADGKKTDYQVAGEGNLIIEGAGGLLVPINESHYMTDLISDFGYPVILVSRSSLGTINHTLMSLEILRSRNIPVAGVVMNGNSELENRIAIEKFGSVRVLAEIPVMRSIDRDELTRYGHRILESL